MHCNIFLSAQIYFPSARIYFSSAQMYFPSAQIYFSSAPIYFSSAPIFFSIHRYFFRFTDIFSIHRYFFRRLSECRLYLSFVDILDDTQATGECQFTSAITISRVQKSFIYRSIKSAIKSKQIYE